MAENCTEHLIRWRWYQRHSSTARLLATQGRDCELIGWTALGAWRFLKYDLSLRFHAGPSARVSAGSHLRDSRSLSGACGDTRMMWPFCTCASRKQFEGMFCAGSLSGDEPSRVEQGHLVERGYQPRSRGGVPARLRASAKSSADVQP